MDSAEQSHLHLRYALQKGTERNLLCVDVVPNGLNCNCVCPVCKQDVIARNKGKKREHHFAHRIGADCPGARMTALHMLAQQIIESEKKVMLPDYIGLYYQKITEPIEFDEVILEQSTILDNKLYRPDCVGIKYGDNNNTHRLWIEILVTHEVDSDKTDSIRKSERPCIEIDLSDMLKTNYNEESVTKRIQERKDDRKWICCPKYDAINETNKAQAKQEEEKRKKAEEDELRQKIEEDRKREKYRLQHQAEQRNGQKNNAVSQAYQFEQGPEFDTPKFTPAKKDRIIQAVRGGSVNPKSELYSEDLAKEFNYPYGNNK